LVLTQQPIHCRHGFEVEKSLPTSCGARSTDGPRIQSGYGLVTDFTDGALGTGIATLAWCKKASMSLCAWDG
jgi:hypothetical protein